MCAREIGSVFHNYSMKNHGVLDLTTLTTSFGDETVFVFPKGKNYRIFGLLIFMDSLSLRVTPLAYILALMAFWGFIEAKIFVGEE